MAIFVKQLYTTPVFKQREFRFFLSLLSQIFQLISFSYLKPEAKVASLSIFPPCCSLRGRNTYLLGLDSRTGPSLPWARSLCMRVWLVLLACFAAALS